MNIFANLATPQKSKRQREVILLFGEDFCDFQLVRETIQQFRYDFEDVVFITQTKLLNREQEEMLDSFLKRELGEKYTRCAYRPTERYTRNGQPCVRSYHRNLECYIFTSDSSEQDIVELNTAAKKIVGFATIVRRPTPQETKDRIKRERKAALKEKFSNIGTALFAVIFFASIILGGFYASEHKEIFSVVGAIIGIGFILFLLFAVWSFVSESTTSKWKSALRTIGITILIIGVLLLIGYLMPDSYSNYVNDAHRPDRF